MQHFWGWYAREGGGLGRGRGQTSQPIFHVTSTYAELFYVDNEIRTRFMAKEKQD
jgi:hypothetical protein